MSREAVVQAVFLLFAMTAAGVVHVLWLRSALAKRFARPVDFGMTLRGRRLFGDNKRWCGFMALPPAAALSFVVVSALCESLAASWSEGLWCLSSWQYAGLGFACGLGFMAAELPNSLVKRQLDIAPGEAAGRPGLRRLFQWVDRFDSELGVLLAAALLVPLSAATWLLVLFGGAALHALFSTVLFLLGIKGRAL